MGFVCKPVEKINSRPSEKPHNQYALFAFVVAVLLFGGNYVAVGFSDRELQPMWGAALRLLLASIVLLVWIKLRRLRFPHGRALGFSIAYGLLYFGINLPLLYWGLLTVNSGVASVIYAAIPSLTLLFAVLIGFEWLRWKGVVGAVIGFLGVAFIFWNALSINLPVLPLFAILGGAVCAGIAGLLLKTETMKRARLDPTALTAVAAIVGTLTLTSLAFVSKEKTVFPTSITTWGALSWLVVGTAAGYSLSTFVYQRWPASNASFVNALPPLVTVPAASLLLSNEGITPIFFGGSALVILGTYISGSNIRSNDSDSLRAHAKAQALLRDSPKS